MRAIPRPSQHATSKVNPFDVRCSAADVAQAFQPASSRDFPVPSPCFIAGDWKVARTRRQECLRYIPWLKIIHPFPLLPVRPVSDDWMSLFIAWMSLSIAWKSVFIAWKSMSIAWMSLFVAWKSVSID
jgi:hypothetical protein